jgi:enolase
LAPRPSRTRFASGQRCSTLRKSLKDAGHNTNVGDEGGFAPDLKSAEEALTFVIRAVEGAGYTPGTDVAIALDPVASEFFKDGRYVYAGGGVERTVEEHIDYVTDLADRYRSRQSRTPWRRTTSRAGDW